jgi:hypothetical protein
METMFSLLTLAAIAYGLYRTIKWMIRSGRSLTPREQPLTPNDLKVLEQSAAQLMADLRAVSDECVAKVEAACSRAERMLSSDRTQTNREIRAEAESPRSGMLIGEIELVKGLQEIVHR